MKQFHHNRGYRRTTAQRRLQPSAAPRRGRSAVLAVVAFSLLVGFGLLYVGQVNTVATSGLAIKGMQQQIRELQRVNQDLELRTASLSSLSTVEQTSRDLDLSVRAKIDFLPAVSETVARSR